MVKDINAAGDGDPSNLIAVGSTLFFQADDGTHGYELWSYDLSTNDAQVAPTPATTVAPTPTTTVPAIAVNPSGAPSLKVINALPRASLSTSPMLLGEKISVTYRGFTPGETVQFVIASTPRLLGAGVANASGVVTVTGKIPSSIGVGEHTIALYSPVSGAGFRQVVTVSAATLPQTGSNSMSPLAAGVLMLGVGAVLTARRRAALR
jgi:LPXTG-motif cell wall-anchored protein